MILKKALITGVKVKDVLSLTELFMKKGNCKII